VPGSHFTEPTTGYWQELVPADAVTHAPPWRFGYPARLPDGRVLMLPIRPLPGDGTRAVASLIANQASFAVVRVLAGCMADLARSAAPEVVVGLPTLGFAFAPLVAEGLGHTRYVPLGYSRKFWYDEALSAPVQSITTPGAGKRVYLDPNQLPLVRGRNVAIVDDAISSGSTLAAVVPLLASVGCTVVTIVVAMLQGEAWRDRLGAIGPQWPARVRGVFASPRLVRVADGWTNEGG
jgi:adenine/guanine phosphoribosyltransferase-like PRPP-binding protein